MARAALITALLALALALACSGEDGSGPTPAPRAVPTTSALPTAAATATERPPGATPPSASPTPVRLEEAVVTRVVDGDTIDVLIDGREARVRYIGIDTPETVDPRRPVGCFGREASDRNRELVAGRTVGLERDVSEMDAFGRLLRYVWADGRMVNAALVEEGYATAAAFPPDVAYADLFLSLQRRARDEDRGLWSACPAAGTATPRPSPAGADSCDYSGTTVPMIKGNISLTTGEKIYHVPGGEYYEQTVIDEAAGERWFCTEDQALAAGWRRSRR